MPEGDTIYRTAVSLRTAIEGETVLKSTFRDGVGDPDLIDQHNVVDVEARGKHLLIHFDNQHVLHSHMGMTGSWHLYRRGERWRKAQRLAAVVITVQQIEAVCFSPKTMELLTPSAFRRHHYLHQLGPDILASTFDESEVLRRFRDHHASPIGIAIMNQTVLCGIGNVYKSELLFLASINPFRSVSEIGDEQLLDLIADGKRLMRKNLSGYPRRTRFDGRAERTWVYGRKGKPCAKCGQKIASSKQGDAGRSTYWCPSCQA